MDKYIVGVDVGGHNIRTVVTDLEGTILTRKNARIDRDADNAETNVALLAGEITSAMKDFGISESSLAGIGVGVPSPVNPESGTLIASPNIPYWTGLKLSDALQKYISVPVEIENDVNIATLGEYWKGSARGCNNFFFIGIGTGIGGGAFINGRVHTGKHFSAGEIGYLVLAPNQKERRVGDLGWFESVASGLALDQDGRRSAFMNSTGKLAEIAGSPDKVNAVTIFEAAAQGDKDASAILEQAFEYYAMAVVNISALLDPDAIIFGGGIASQGEALLAPIRKKAAAYELFAPDLRCAELGEEAQIYGAVYLIASKYL
jgi:glucokinase